MENKRIGYIGDKNTLVGLQIAGIGGSGDNKYIRIVPSDISAEDAVLSYNDLSEMDEIGLLFVCDFVSVFIQQIAESNPSVVVIPSRNKSIHLY